MRFFLLPLAAAAFLLAGVSTAGATVVSQPFTSSGSWTIPADAASIDILVVGAGGGGGGGGPSGPTAIEGGGGGGGEVKVCTGIPVTAGQALAVTVGAGGSAANFNQVGSTGGSSSVSYASSTVCSGNGGQGGNGGQVGPPYYQGGDSGNANSGGSSDNSQAGGGGGGAGGVGAAITFPGGVGKAGSGGPGIAPGSLGSPGLFADVTATLYGGGGGGGRTDSNASLAGDGGTGGGAPGRPKAPGPAGQANTGGGGGGNGGGGGDGGGDGGSGYVVVRYVALSSNTTPPVVSGTNLVGQTVSTTEGTWTESPTSYAYKWQRCDDDQGTGCVDIGGATASTYPTVSADVGKYLRSRVTATNAGGNASAYSSNYLRITPNVALTVSRDGTGSGSVGGSGIDCGSTCSVEVLEGTEVTLTATANAGSQFAGWGGACSGTSTCTVTMDAARSVTATFNLIPAPSNSFTEGAPVSRGSTISTRVRVPGPGQITQRGTRSTRSGAAARALVCKDSRAAGSAGSYTLTCRVNAATRRAQLSGRVRVVLLTTFTPTGGTARTQTRVLTLPARKPSFTG